MNSGSVFDRSTVSSSHLPPRRRRAQTPSRDGRRSNPSTPPCHQPRLDGGEHGVQIHRQSGCRLSLYAAIPSPLRVSSGALFAAGSEAGPAPCARLLTGPFASTNRRPPAGRLGRWRPQAASVAASPYATIARWNSGSVGYCQRRSAAAEPKKIACPNRHTGKIFFSPFSKVMSFLLKKLWKFWEMPWGMPVLA